MHDRPLRRTFDVGTPCRRSRVCTACRLIPAAAARSRIVRWSASVTARTLRTLSPAFNAGPDPLSKSPELRGEDARDRKGDPCWRVGTVEDGEEEAVAGPDEGVYLWWRLGGRIAFVMHGKSLKNE